MDNTDRKSKGNFLTDYLRMFAKHKFMIIISLVVVFLGSAIFGSTLPKLYKAKAVFRRLASISSERRSSGQSAQEDLEVMKQVILSRSNLVEVIKDVGLDSSYRDLPEIAREAKEGGVVVHVRKNLELQQKANGVFEISYRNKDPEMAARVANAVMTRYHEGVLKTEREQMEDTVAFLQRKVEEYQARKSASSEGLARFKAKHATEMPGSELSNSAQLRSFRDQLAEVEAELSDAETAKKEKEKQLREVDSRVIGKTIVETNPLVAQYQAQLDKLELERATLLTRFTPRHPDVVKKENEIQSLKSLIEKVAEKVTTTEEQESNPVYVKLLQDLNDARTKLAAAKRKKENLLAKIADYEERVRNAPALVKEVNNLEAVDASNQSLLDHYTRQLEDAKISQEREKDQGTRFRILDYARKSSASAKSNKLKVSLLGLLVGGGLGLGLAVLTDQMDTSFKDVEDASSFLDIPIIGTIPVINTTAERAREKKKEALGWMIVAVLVILLGAALIVTSLTSFPGR